jgi:hypothetical protein
MLLEFSDSQHPDDAEAELESPVLSSSFRKKRLNNHPYLNNPSQTSVAEALFQLLLDLNDHPRGNAP